MFLGVGDLEGAAQGGRSSTELLSKHLVFSGNVKARISISVWRTIICSFVYKCLHAEVHSSEFYIQFKEVQLTMQAPLCLGRKGKQLSAMTRGC